MHLFLQCVLVLVANLCATSDGVLNYSMKSTPYDPSSDQCKECVRKCCDIGYYAEGTRCIQCQNCSDNFVVPIYSKRHMYENRGLNIDELSLGHVNCSSYVLDPIRYPKTDAFYVQRNGNIVLGDTNRIVEITNSEYCLEYTMEHNLIAYVCSKDCWDSAKCVNLKGKNQQLE